MIDKIASGIVTFGTVFLFLLCCAVCGGMTFSIITGAW